MNWSTDGAAPTGAEIPILDSGSDWIVGLECDAAGGDDSGPSTEGAIISGPGLPGGELWAEGTWACPTFMTIGGTWTPTTGAAPLGCSLELGAERKAPSFLALRR